MKNVQSPLSPQTYLKTDSQELTNSIAKPMYCRELKENREAENNRTLNKLVLAELSELSEYASFFVREDQRESLRALIFSILFSSLVFKIYYIYWTGTKKSKLQTINLSKIFESNKIFYIDSSNLIVSKVESVHIQDSRLKDSNRNFSGYLDCEITY